MQRCRPDKALGARVHLEMVRPRWSHKPELIRTYQATKLGWLCMDRLDTIAAGGRDWITTTPDAFRELVFEK